jgi:hypothetical protein
MMMKSIIYKFLFLFYRYYDKGTTKNVAYFSAITALLMVLFLNVYSFLIFTKIDENYLTFSGKYSSLAKVCSRSIYRSSDLLGNDQGLQERRYTKGNYG